MADGEVRKRKHHRVEEKGLKALPKPVLVVVALCIALLILIPMTRKRTAADSPAPAKPAASTPDLPLTSASSTVSLGDLQLGEASVDPVTHKIKGVAKNTSARLYNNVQVSFRTVDRNGKYGAVWANIGKLEAHGSSRFETQPMPANWRGYSLPEITGTPQ